MVTREVEFESGGLRLVGDLRVPEDFDDRRGYPAVIVQGSLTSVKEQMPRLYAERLAAEGFVALAFDYSHYGESEGEPRQLEAPSEKLRDLQAAVTYLSDLPYVQSVGMVGVCTSAGNAIELAATDPRLAVLATVAAALPDPALFQRQFPERAAERKKAAQNARRKYEQTGEVDMIAVYSETDPGAMNHRPTPGAYDYYLNPQRGGIEEFGEFDPISSASSVAVATIVVHSDNAAMPDAAKKLHDLVRGPKELAWGHDGHFDYYDSEHVVSEAAEQVARFFRTHLPAQSV
jgi:fermentation-respiration switch protein FrsA (DUF1100 family)